MSEDDVRQLVLSTKDELDKEGKLVYDWREAKRRKAEEKAKAAADGKASSS